MVFFSRWDDSFSGYVGESLNALLYSNLSLANNLIWAIPKSDFELRLAAINYFLVKFEIKTVCLVQSESGTVGAGIGAP